MFVLFHHFHYRSIARYAGFCVNPWVQCSIMMCQVIFCSLSFPDFSACIHHKSLGWFLTTVSLETRKWLCPLVHFVQRYQNGVGLVLQVVRTNQTSWQCALWLAVGGSSALSSSPSTYPISSPSWPSHNTLFRSRHSENCKRIRTTKLAFWAAQHTLDCSA